HMKDGMGAEIESAEEGARDRVPGAEGGDQEGGEEHPQQRGAQRRAHRADRRVSAEQQQWIERQEITDVDEGAEAGEEEEREEEEQIDEPLLGRLARGQGEGEAGQVAQPAAQREQGQYPAELQYQYRRQLRQEGPVEEVDGSEDLQQRQGRRAGPHRLLRRLAAILDPDEQQQRRHQRGQIAEQGARLLAQGAFAPRDEEQGVQREGQREQQRARLLAEGQQEAE